MDEMKPKGFRKFLYSCLIVSLLVLVWGVVYLVVGNPMRIASPIEALRALATLSLESSFWQSVAFSVAHVFLGWLLGCLLGVLLFALEALTPISGFLNVLRKLFCSMPLLPSVLLLCSALFGCVDLMVATIPMVMSAGTIWQNLNQGQETIDFNTRVLAECGSSRKDVWTYLLLPHLTFYFADGLRIAWKRAYGMGILVEFVAQVNGTFGGDLQSDYTSLMTERLFARVMFISVLGVFLYGFVGWLVGKIRFSPRISPSDEYARNGHSYPLVFDCVNKSFGEFHIFEDFSHIFPNGKVTAVYGPREAGKTTLLLMAAGLCKDDRRRYQFPPTAAAVIMKEPCLIPNLTVRENLLYVNRAANTEKILKSLALERETDLFPYQIDFSTQKRVAIARAIAFDGGIGIFDEPFEGMDDDTKALSAAALFGAYKGKTVLFSTPYEEEAKRFGDEVLKL